jgi:hypothetical protein
MLARAGAKGAIADDQEGRKDGSLRWLISTLESDSVEFLLRHQRKEMEVRRVGEHDPNGRVLLHKLNVNNQ